MRSRTRPLHRCVGRVSAQLLALMICWPLLSLTASAQNDSRGHSENSRAVPPAKDRLLAQAAWVAAFVDQTNGVNVADLVKRGLGANVELVALRIEIERARARLTQSGTRPNPTLDFEQQNGVLNSPGERSASVGFSLPLEVGGQRGARVAVARVAIDAAAAELADRERRLAHEIRHRYADALIAARELEMTDRLHGVQLETSRFVEARVSVGDAAPLERDLLLADVERLKARRVLIESALQTAVLKLRHLAAIPDTETMLLKETLESSLTINNHTGIDTAVAVALRQRPDIVFARLAEDAAQAGYRLARAEAIPNVTAFARYGQTSSAFDETPVGFLRDKDRLVTFGVSITLPLLNRNQGARADAQLAVRQAEARRQFVESVIRTEVISAYRRLESVEKSLSIYQNEVITRLTQNVNTMRAAYEIGAFRIGDLLAEQRRLLEAQRELTDAMGERYRAFADIQAAIGSSEK